MGKDGSTLAQENEAERQRSLENKVVKLLYTTLQPDGVKPQWGEQDDNGNLVYGSRWFNQQMDRDLSITVRRMEAGRNLATVLPALWSGWHKKTNKLPEYRYFTDHAEDNPARIVALVTQYLDQKDMTVYFHGCHNALSTCTALRLADADEGLTLMCRFKDFLTGVHDLFRGEYSE